MSDMGVEVEALREFLKPGASFRLAFGPGNINNRLCHVRAIVDDDQYVMRQWSQKWGGHWHYSVEHWVWFEAMARHIVLLRKAS